MITDEERRAVAERLRRLQSRQFRDEDKPEITTWEDIGAAVLDSETWGKCDRLRSRDNRTRAVRSIIAGRLADLIEPEPERTCRMEYAGEVPPSVKYSCYFCSECGSPIYNDMEPSYCPYCGAKVVDDG